MYSFIPIITEIANGNVTWKCKKKCILCQFWNTLAEYF